jgi:hypothetical protein
MRGSSGARLLAYGCDKYKDAPDHTWDFVTPSQVRGTRGFIHNLNHNEARACLDVSGHPVTHAG